MVQADGFIMNQSLFLRWQIHVRTKGLVGNLHILPLSAVPPGIMCSPSSVNETNTVNSTLVQYLHMIIIAALLIDPSGVGSYKFTTAQSFRPGLKPCVYHLALPNFG